MKQYDYDEMRAMQEKALERVRDMQMRAKTTAEQADRDINGDKSEKKTKKDIGEKSDYYKENFYNTVKSMPRQNHIRMPVDIPEQIKPYDSFKEYFEPENKKIAEQQQQITKAGLFDDVLKEPDMALLFALMLLMQSDKADEELMMSLLYIML